MIKLFALPTKSLLDTSVRAEFEGAVNDFIEQVELAGKIPTVGTSFLQEVVIFQVGVMEQRSIDKSIHNVSRADFERALAAARRTR